MEKRQKIEIHFRGGILSPGYLKTALILIGEAGVQQVRLGLRQQLILDMAAARYPGFAAACREQGIIQQQAGAPTQNIVSSYYTDGIFNQDSWLKEGTYKDILDQFNYNPRLKINICDQSQRSVLFFTGNLNWISSDSAQFWRLFIRFPHSRTVYNWPELIYSNDIGAVGLALEQLICQRKQKDGGKDPAPGAGPDLYAALKKTTAFSYISKAVTEPVQLPGFALAYYEGFNRYSGGYWLGIYRREETFPVNFLIDLCDNCISTRIGELYATTWKSLIIKGIEPGKRQRWDDVLGKYRINVRHAANELNWQIEQSQEALALKRQIIRYFDKEDVRTFGLCFGIQTKPAAHMFASIVISGCAGYNQHKLKYLAHYDILYQSQFNPNEGQLTCFRERVDRDHIGPYLVSLCKLFYEQQLDSSQAGQPVRDLLLSTAEPAVEQPVYQCPNCLSFYDEAVGDPGQGVPPGTCFSAIQATYSCPLCSTGGNHFIICQPPAAAALTGSENQLSSINT